MHSAQGTHFIEVLTVEQARSKLRKVLAMAHGISAGRSRASALAELRASAAAAAKARAEAERKAR